MEIDRFTYKSCRFAAKSKFEDLTHGGHWMSDQHFFDKNGGCALIRGCAAIRANTVL